MYRMVESDGMLLSCKKNDFNLDTGEHLGIGYGRNMLVAWNMVVGEKTEIA